MEAQTITRDMTVSEITTKFPQTVEILLSYGLHCVGCGAASIETLEQGALGHGMQEDTFLNLIKDLNTIVKESKSDKPIDESLSITITDAAAEKVKDIMEKEGKTGFALRIAVVPGGCAGFSYQFMFDDTREDDDHVIEKNGLKVYMTQDSIELMNGCTVDFVEGLQGSGFKVENPNATGGCGCGKSFS